MSTFSNKPLGFIYDYRGRAQTLWELSDLTLSSINGIPISSFGAGLPYFVDLEDQQVLPGNPGTILFVSSDGATIIPLGIGDNLTVSSGSLHGTGGGAGVSYFSSLIDTFASYSGKLGDLVYVRNDGTGLSSIPSGTFALAANLANYIPTSVSSSFAQVTSLSLYIPYTASGQFASSSVSANFANYIPLTSSGMFASSSVSANFANYIPISVSGQFASSSVSANFANYIPLTSSGQFASSSVSANFNNYIPTSVSNTFSTTAVSGWVTSNFVHLSGNDNITAGLSAVSFSAANFNGLSATLKQISATTFLNLPSATTGQAGVIRALDNVTTHFLAGDGTWLTPAGGGGTGSPSGPNTSVQWNNANTFSGTSNMVWDNATNTLKVSSISALNYQNLPSTGGGGGVSAFSALADVSTTFTYTGASGNLVVVNASATGLSSMAFVFLASSTFLTPAQAASSYIPISGGVSATGYISGLYPTASSHFVTKAYADTLTGTGMSQATADTLYFPLSGAKTITGPVSGHSTSAFFNTISATTYLNVTGLGSGGVSNFSSLSEVSSIRNPWFAGTSGHMVVVSPSANGLSSVAISSTPITFLDVSSFIPVSGGVSATGYISGLTPTANSHFVTKAYADGLTGTGMSQGVAEALFVNVSGDAMTGNLGMGGNQISGASVVSATTVNAAGLNTGGATMLGQTNIAQANVIILNGYTSPISVLSALSGVSTSAIFNTISATNYLNYPSTGGGGGVSYFSALSDVSGSKPNFYTGASGDFVIVNASATGLSSIAFSYVDPAGFYSASDAVNYALYAESAFLNASGDTMGGNLNMGGYAINNVGQISAVSGFFTHLSATNYYNVTAGFGAGSPGGSTGQVQFHGGAGTFAGDANMTYASATGKLSVSSIGVDVATLAAASITTITNTPVGQTPTLSTHIATKGYVDSLSSNYIPTGVSSTFSTTAVSGWANTTFVHVSGNDNITGSLSAVGLSATNLSGISGIIRNISATTYFNLTNSLPANIAISSADGFLTSSQGNTAFVNTSGDTMTGSLLAPALSSTTISSITATFNTISATTYQNLGNSLANYAISSAANPLVLSSVLSANYMPTSISSTFSTTAVSGWVTTNFVHVSGNDNITGSISAVGLSATNLSAISGIIRNVSATTYFNLTNSLPANIAISSTDGFLTSSQGNAAFVNTSGDTMTGGLVAPSLSSTTLSSISAIITLIANTASGQTPTLAGHLATKGYVDGQIAGGGLTQAAADPIYVNVSGDSMTGGLSGLTTSAIFGTISATTYLNLNVTGGGGGVSYFSALTDVSGTRNPWFTATSGHMVVVNASATGLSSVAVSTTPITFIDTSTVLYTSGGTLTGALSGHSTSAFFNTISATNYLNVVATTPANISATTISAVSSYISVEVLPTGNINNGIQFNNNGVENTTSSLIWNNTSSILQLSGGLSLGPNIIPFNTPSAGVSSLIFVTDRHANKSLLEVINEAGRDWYAQPSFMDSWVINLTPATGTIVPAVVGGTPVTAAPTTYLNTTTLPAVYPQTPSTKLINMPHFTLQATAATNDAGVRFTNNMCWMGSGAGLGGWYMDTLGTFSGTLAGSGQWLVGLTNATALLGFVNLTGVTNYIGFGAVSANHTPAGTGGIWPPLTIMWNNGAGTASSLPIGSFSCAPSSLYRMILHSPGYPTSGFYYEVKEVNTGVTVTGSVLNDPKLPLFTTYFSPCWKVWSSAASKQLHIVRAYVEIPLII